MNVSYVNITTYVLATKCPISNLICIGSCPLLYFCWTKINNVEFLNNRNIHKGTVQCFGLDCVVNLLKMQDCSIMEVLWSKKVSNRVSFQYHLCMHGFLLYWILQFICVLNCIQQNKQHFSFHPHWYY